MYAAPKTDSRGYHSLFLFAVNDLLKTEIAQLHAFSQKTYTPAVSQVPMNGESSIRLGLSL
jgi:hypothetical protein